MTSKARADQSGIMKAEREERRRQRQQEKRARRWAKRAGKACSDPVQNLFGTSALPVPVTRRELAR